MINKLIKIGDSVLGTNNHLLGVRENERIPYVYNDVTLSGTYAFSAEDDRYKMLDAQMNLMVDYSSTSLSNIYTLGSTDMYSVIWQTAGDSLAQQSWDTPTIYNHLTRVNGIKGYSSLGTLQLDNRKEYGSVYNYSQVTKYRMSPEPSSNTVAYKPFWVNDAHVSAYSSYNAPFFVEESAAMPDAVIKHYTFRFDDRYPVTTYGPAVSAKETAEWIQGNETYMRMLSTNLPTFIDMWRYYSGCNGSYTLGSIAFEGNRTPSAISGYWSWQGNISAYGMEPNPNNV